MRAYRVRADENKTQPNPPQASGEQALEWYPVGHLIIWAVALAALISVGLILAFGVTDPAFIGELEKKLAEAIKSSVSEVSSGAPMSNENIATMTKLAIAMMPAGGAIAIASSLLFSLWISARVTFASEQFERPRPDLAAISYPTGTALAVAIAMAASFLPQPMSVVAAAALGALLFAYLLMGLAVIHYADARQSMAPICLMGALTSAYCLQKAWR